jgi:two-component system chemotaxis response regulator CheY
MQILVVDDSKAMRLIIRRTLRQAGFDADVVEAENGKQALEVLRATRPVLILSDWNMPEMTGIDFLKRVRLADDRIPFGFVTSEQTPDMRHQAAEAGANFLIGKPFTAEAFTRALSPVLG